MEEPEAKVEAGAPAWMVTFADLMSLLLTFFVLLLSFSSLEIDKFNTMAGSIRSAFGMRSAFDVMNHPRGKDIKPSKTHGDFESARSEQMENLNDSLIVQLRAVLEKSGSVGAGNVKLTDRGVVLQIDGDVVFGAGGTAIGPEAAKILDELATVAATTTSVIEVEGHSDNSSMSGSRYESNWELSAVRAASAVRHLTGGGIPPGRLRAVGYGDTRPVASNASPEGRARNRRVEFLFLTKESYNGPSFDGSGSLEESEEFGR